MVLLSEDFVEYDRLSDACIPRLCVEGERGCWLVPVGDGRKLAEVAGQDKLS